MNDFILEGVNGVCLRAPSDIMGVEQGGMGPFSDISRLGGIERAFRRLELQGRKSTEHDCLVCEIVG